MNKEQKEDYIGFLILKNTPLLEKDSNKIRTLKNLVPTILFKFRKFDKYTFDMIDNNYVYLADATKLDDPFDCLITIDTKEIINKSNKTLPKEMLEFMFDIILKSPVFKNQQSKEEIKNIIYQGIYNGKICINEITKFDANHIMYLKNQITYIEKILSVFNKCLEDVPRFSELVKKLYRSKDRAKVCSFTTERDNKVMWSLYANIYKGYCIEYEVPRISEILNILYPVTYKRKKNSNVVKILIQCALELIIKKSLNTETHHNIACLGELFCSKDIDWEYQNEWRLLSLDRNRIDKLKIKAIYLGFDVKKRNELRIINRAKKLNFKVYKMNPPSGSNELTYTSII